MVVVYFWDARYTTRGILMCGMLMRVYFHHHHRIIVREVVVEVVVVAVLLTIGWHLYYGLGKYLITIPTIIEQYNQIIQSTRVRMRERRNEWVSECARKNSIVCVCECIRATNLFTIHMLPPTQQ